MDASPSSTRAKVAHLSRRAGFGLPAAELDALAAGGYAAAIDHYMDASSGSSSLPIHPPRLVDDPNVADVSPLQRWWLDRMIRSPRQLEEKMSLFWHGFFATSNDKVDTPSFMYEQNMLFRTHALDDFQTLLTKVCIDRAMLLWLDGDGSTKDHPNENFARECMELFSIGVGHYTQSDVRAAARAFTGWSIDDHNRRVFDPASHDAGMKTFLGHSGPLNHADIAGILANHPACGRFIAQKLWTFFVYEHPEDAVREELAAVYRESRRSIRAVIRHMFGMPTFGMTDRIAVRVKSPAEYVVTAVRELGARVRLSDLNDHTGNMGQNLLYPPNVGGWPTGARWINSSTVVARFGFAEWLLERHAHASKDRVSWKTLPHLYGAPDWQVTLRHIATRHLIHNPSAATMNALRRYADRGVLKDDVPASLEALLQLALVSPEYYCA